jgi:hypothetical protein
VAKLVMPSNFHASGASAPADDNSARQSSGRPKSGRLSWRSNVAEETKAPPALVASTKQEDEPRAEERPPAPAAAAKLPALNFGSSMPYAAGAQTMRTYRADEPPPPSAYRYGARTERLRGSQYTINEGVCIGVQKTPTRRARPELDGIPLPLGGLFSFDVPEGLRSPSRSARPGSPGKRLEDLAKLEVIEAKVGVSVEYVTPRGETAVKVGGAKALTAFFDQFCELSA